MELLIKLGHDMLRVFSSVVDFFSTPVAAPWYTSTFWQNIDDSFFGDVLDQLPWVDRLIDFLIDVLPNFPEITVLQMMVGYGLYVYLVFVLVKFILDIVL